DFAKKMAGKYFGTRLSLKSEIVEDIAKQQYHRAMSRGEHGQFSPEPHTSEILSAETKEHIGKTCRQHYTRFLDEKIPALDNHTPREAAKKPGLRNKLVDLMKDHINGLEIQRRGKNLDLNIDWVLDELGLQELK
ncbi:MAG: hypothetical protein V1809_02225, partial [Planctomycetota bacterium]